MSQIVAEQKLGEALGYPQPLGKCAFPRDLAGLNDALLEIYIRVCSDQVRRRARFSSTA